MKVDLLLLAEAITKLKYEALGYGSDVTSIAEVTVQDEDLQGNKLGDLIAIKCTIVTTDKYNDNKEVRTTRILEVPGATDGLGKQFHITTQKSETYEVKKKV